MTLRSEILKEHSKAQCNKIVAWIGSSQKRFNELLFLFLNDEYRVVQRAAWPLAYCAIAHPDLIKRHLGKLIRNLGRPNLHSAVKRNTIRLMQDIDVPKRYHGELMNICFAYIASPQEAAAVKAFSLRVLQNLSKAYPDILPELRTLIEDRWEYESAAFRSRAAKITGDAPLPV